MKTKSIVLLIILASIAGFVYGQKTKQDTTYKKYFIGTSGFMIANLLPNPPSFYQLNLGYRITKKDVVSIELKTWTYRHPLGIPYGDDYGTDENEYPGFVREYGIGFVYQRFLWKGLYASASIAPFLQKYVDKNGNKIQNGFQLFNTYRIGYHVKLFKNRFFIEPSIAMTHWPVNTNTPEGFKKLENPWPNYFLFEPGFHLGYKF